jgi:tRNA(Ile)-lysidine synthase
MAASDEPGHHSFVKAIVWSLTRRCGVSRGAKLLVATSGGADSVALLRALAIIAPRRRWQLELTIGHVRHNLRSAEETEQDVRLVTHLAGTLDLPLLQADIQPVRSAGHNIEAAARRERYRLLEQMAGTCQAAYVATGHHGDDQLETILMRLLRGASVQGMTGIAWQRPLGEHTAPKLIRPMLATDRGMARAFLGALGQSWCEDRTNQDRSRWRARLRHDVLPVLHELRPDAAHKAVQLAEHMTDTWEVLSAAITAAAENAQAGPDGTAVDRSYARTLPRTVLIGLLRRLLIDSGVSPDQLGRRQLDPIVRAITDARGGERSFDLDSAVRVILTRNVVRLVAR